MVSHCSDHLNVHKLTAALKREGTLISEDIHCNMSRPFPLKICTIFLLLTACTMGGYCLKQRDLADLVPRGRVRTQEGHQATNLWNLESFGSPVAQQRTVYVPDRARMLGPTALAAFHDLTCLADNYSSHILAVKAVMVYIQPPS